jgi:16S rRNA (uracil1498-N3)-methyltransferase
MQFIYHQNSGKNTLHINNNLYKYIFKIRRQKSYNNLFLRNLNDNNIYEYKIISISKKETTLQLIGYQNKIVGQKRYLHIALCMIDTKIIDKTISGLNELGVNKLSLIFCKLSQKNYNINYERLKKILINSSQQCGRSDLMEIENFENIDIFLKNNPESFLFNFSKNSIKNNISNIETIIIGCEGGFSKKEISKFSSNKIIGVNSSLILKSETAVLGVAANILF